MKTSKILTIKGFSFEKVQFYTLQVEDREAEFSNFVSRMSRLPANKQELGELIIFIQEIGTKYGATKNRFHHEAAAEALSAPRLSYIDIEQESLPDFGLRLYCIRLSDSVVVLLNGDRKTARKVQDCPQCFPHFQFANSLAKKLDRAIIEQDITIGEKQLLYTSELELIF